jgi:hypothetical protein
VRGRNRVLVSWVTDGSRIAFDLDATELAVDPDHETDALVAKLPE